MTALARNAVRISGAYGKVDIPTAEGHPPSLRRGALHAVQRLQTKLKALGSAASIRLA
jgi:hypothetical protein